MPHPPAATTITTTVQDAFQKPKKSVTFSSNQGASESISLETFTIEDVLAHDKADDIWVVIDGEVFDLTSFVDEHPGGRKVLLPVAGKDATKQFRKHHRDAILIRYRPRFKIGVVEPEEKKLRSRFSFWRRSH
ncbi:cytochrome b5 [Pseudovirgaria hyperparasitica]|uniref:Cytochrome b5 n=1 Tax=Pseudovirgaria hyperparasitica TaxID=470096 RepID=A0A6A6W0N2_9PEZI|nr:cytochrome b5 [Pseudovirgaria hyperparasitica]KAF2756478.1 cytochrome b5 [Pseudovirgaria hyperparasitica]